MVALAAMVAITIILTLAIPDENPAYFEVKLVVNVMILGIQGIYLRMYIKTTMTFLKLMKTHFHYEY